MNFFKKYLTVLFKRWMIISFVILLFTSGAFTHSFPVQRIGHRIEMTVSSNTISFLYSIWLTELESAVILGLININKDDKITEEEKDTYFRQLAVLLEEGGDEQRGFEIFLDGKRIRFKIIGDVKLFKPCGMTYLYRNEFNLKETHKLLFDDYNDIDIPGEEEIYVTGTDGIKILDQKKEWRKFELTFNFEPEPVLLAKTTVQRVEKIPEVAAVQKKPDITPKKETIQKEPEIAKKPEVKLEKVEKPEVKPVIIPETKIEKEEEKESEALFFGEDEEVQEKGSLLKRFSYDRLKGKVQQILQGKLSAYVIIVTLFIAVFIGGLHALRPGHGKTLVAAYLVGERGTIWHAFLLGTVVTLTHTISVIMLGLIVLFASQFIVPEKLYPWMSVSSGLLVIGLGVWLFLRAYKNFILTKFNLARAGEVHEHSHFNSGKHTHDHDLSNHGHSHAHIDTSIPLWNIFTLGIVGGIVPCPNAMVILLIAISLNRVAFGVAIITAYSLGIAAVLITVGILIVKARSFIDKFEHAKRYAVNLTVYSAVAIIGVGFLITIRALISIGIIDIGL